MFLRGLSEYLESDKTVLFDLLHACLGNIGFQSTRSGGGDTFLPLDCRAKAGVKGVLFSQTLV